MNIRKILFTGNILRIGSDLNNKKTNQTINIKWLHGLIGGTLEQVTGLSCDIVTWEKNSKFDSNFVYKAQGLPVNLESFGYLFNSKKLHKDVIAYFEFNFKDSLVIGFEMAPVMLKIFDRLGIPYVDFMIHPARFMNDLVLGVRTNIKNAYDCILINRLSEERILAEAGLRKARLVKAKQIKMNPHTAIFAGQVEFDTSLISSEGGFLDIFDFEEKLKDLVNSYGGVVYKPHPYSKNKKSYEMFMDLGFENNYDNFYELISQTEISSVYALTSSVVYEASYFGKNSHWFSDYPFDFGDGSTDFDKLRFIPVIGEFINSTFWCDVLGAGMGMSMKGNRFSGASVYLNGEVRKSLNVNWGYEVFE
ncbi:MAG: hypothetical protein RPS47_07260 [Colwellia sp.]